MDLKGSILELIGNTPMVKLARIGENPSANILVKLEYLNPSGSIKDRIALEMIERAEKEGKLRTGFTIIESSTGNTGIALSFVGAVKGYKVIIYETMPEKIGMERKRTMENFGAEVRLIDAHARAELREKSIGGADVELPGRVLCDTLEKNNSNVWWARQFSNPANVAAHRKTGYEILAQTDSRIDSFVAAIGTGGTLMGIAETLRERFHEIRIIGVQPGGDKVSIVPGKPYPRTNISGGIISDMLEKRLIDDVVRVKDKDAIDMAHRLWKEEGLFAGISSGANVFVALQEMQKLRNGNVVTVLPDSGSRYLNEEHFIT